MRKFSWAVAIAMFATGCTQITWAQQEQNPFDGTAQQAEETAVDADSAGLQQIAKPHLTRAQRRVGLEYILANSTWDKLGPYEEVEFAEVIADVKDTFGIQIRVDHSAMEDELDIDTLISFSSSDLTLGTALQELLAPHNATYIVDDGYLKIISMDVAGDAVYHIQRTYDCKQILAGIPTPSGSQEQQLTQGQSSAGGGGGLFNRSSGNSGAEMEKQDAAIATSALACPPASKTELELKQEQLKKVLQSCVAPGDWMETSGEGSIEFLGNVMIVSQHTRGHEQLKDLLDQISMQMNGQR
ncbi:MAG: hypothetical protein R3C03_06770 [Pirellulaceae bacterium]